MQIKYFMYTRQQKVNTEASVPKQHEMKTCGGKAPCTLN